MKEESAKWYDQMYPEWKMYQRPYWKGNMVYRYVVAAAMIRRYLGGKKLKILDVGCGTGQFAHYLYDLGYRNYKGFDYSGVAIKYAQTLWGGLPFEFFCGDAFDAKNYSYNYNVVVCMSVLEHVERDLAMLNMVKSGAGYVGAVPNYMCKGHVRCFETPESVISRFGKVLNIADVVFVFRQWIFVGTKK